MLNVDFHSHVMPGVDDGSRSAIETIAMARGLTELGVERLYLTPHQFKLGNRFTLVELQKRVDDVWRILARAGISIEVCRGAEHYYGESLLDAIVGGAELITFRWKDRDCLLVELPMDQPAFGVRRVADALFRRDIQPVMAHPERCAFLERDFDRLLGWRDAGWEFQLNLLSLVGRHGARAERIGREILTRDLYDCAGSDLHRPSQLEWLARAHEEFRSITQGVAHT